jgi:hypothetical protein
MQLFTLEIGLGEHRLVKTLEYSRSINAEHLVEAIIMAKEIFARGLWSPSSNVARLLNESNGENRVVWFRPTAVLREHSSQEKNSTYRHEPHANDNTQGLYLLSMPERARAMAFISPLSDIAHLWEMHALICEGNEARGDRHVPRKRRQKPVLAPV